MADPSDLPDRVKKDLEDALRDGGADKLPNRGRRPPRRGRRLALPDPRPRNPQQLVLIGVILAVFGYLLPIPFRWQIVLVGIICIAVALLTHFMQPQGYAQKFWRGRYLDVPTGRWQERIYRLIYRASRGPQ